VTSKREVREEAAGLGLITATKPESQELCFVDVSVSVDLEQRLAGRFVSGPILDLAGNHLGEHRGLPFYTVGQRSGLGIAAVRPDASPFYVLDLDPERNVVVVGSRQELETARVRLGDCTWIGGSPPPAGARLDVQLRAHGRPHPARIEPGLEGTADVCFDPPVGPASPGQAAVVLNDDEVLGGGTVVRVA